MALRLDTNLHLSADMRQLMLRIGLGLLLLLVALYALVGMPMLEGRRLDAEIAADKARLERRQALMPALASLAAGAQNATLAELLPLKQEPVPRAQAYLMTEQLSHMAIAEGLEPLGVSLNPATLAQDSNSIQAQGVFTGQLPGIRAFLIAVGRMPSLSRMEKVEIRSVDGRLEMLLQLRVALGG